MKASTSHFDAYIEIVPIKGVPTTSIHYTHSHILDVILHSEA